jgi:hypothetical protein
MIGPRKPNAIALVIRPREKTAHIRTGPPIPPSLKTEETESSGYWSALPLPVARPAADVHRTGDLPVPLPPCGVGGLFSGTASRLDALSVYPDRGRLSGGAPDGTTGPPSPRPPWSLRTKGGFPQASCAHDR